MQGCGSCMVASRLASPQSNMFALETEPPLFLRRRSESMPSPAQHRPNFVLAACIDHFVGKWVIRHGSCGSVDQDVRSAALGQGRASMWGVLTVKAKSPGLSIRHNNGQSQSEIRNVLYCTVLSSFRAENVVASPGES